MLSKFEVLPIQFLQDCAAPFTVIVLLTNCCKISSVERPQVEAHFFRLSSSKLLVTEALTVSRSLLILLTSSSANPGSPAKVSAMVGFLNCACEAPAAPIIDQRDIIGMGGNWGGRKPFMLLMRSEAADDSRPPPLEAEAAAAAAAATEFCIIEVENRRGFSKRGLDKAMALAAMAAKKLGLSFEPATTPEFPPANKEIKMFMYF